MTTTLYPTWTLGDLELTSYPFAIEFGGDHGAPETLSELVTSMVGDGDLVRRTGHGNREISIVVVVEGPTLGALADNEATLRAECTKDRTTLTFQPGDIDSAASVFEVLLVEMRQPRDEVQDAHLMHRWELTLTCAPFARSETLTTVSSLPTGGAPSLSVIDTCDSATGWTATRNGVPDVATTFWEPGAVGVVELDSAVTSPERWTLTRTGTVSFASQMYLVAEVRSVSFSNDLGVSGVVASTGAPVQLPIVSRRNLVPGGDSNTYHEVTCLVPGGVSLSSVTFTHVSGAGAVWQGLLVRKVSQTNMPPGSSARQLSRILEVGGTERTPASLHVLTTSGFLGVTAIHTTPFDGSGYSPDMRRWRASGNGTTTNVDARKITGTWEAMQPNPVISRTPSHSLPRGDYILCAAIKSDTATTNTPLPIDWAVKSVTSGQVVGEVTGTGYGWFPVAHQLTIVPIAAMQAPPVRSGALDVEVHLLNPTGTVNMQVEQWWMFTDDEDSALSIVNTAEGNLWLDSPSVDSSVPLLWVGPERPLSYHPADGLVAQGTHTFKPGQVLVTSVSDSNDYLQAELSYYENWHTNAPR